MKIKRLEMTNFRQFSGQQSLDFAADPKQNVTIIMGQNGAGKTGIFRAILFALFGDTELEQDADNADVHLINDAVMRTNQMRSVQARVSLSFEHAGVNYQIQRTVSGRFDGRNYIQQSAQDQKCQLIIEAPGALPEVENNRVMINQKIEAILRRDIREFFFFDAESLQILSDLSNSATRGKVRNGIYQLLQVQDLATAKDRLHDLHLRIERDIRNKSKDSETQAQQQQLDRVDTDIEKHKMQIKDLKDNIQRGTTELTEKQSRYKDSTAERELMAEINSKTNENVQLKQTLDLRLTNLTELIIKGSAQLYEVLVRDVSQKVAALRNSSQDNIPKFSLEKSLEDDVCALCGHELDDDPDAKAHIKELLRLFKYSQSATYLPSIEQGISEITNRHDNVIQTQSAALKAYTDDRQAYTANQADLDNLQNQVTITANELAEANGLGDAIQNIKDDLAKENAELETHQNALPDLKKQRDELSRALTQSQSADSEVQYLVRENKLLQGMEDSLTKILDEYSDESRQQLESSTLKLFKKFIASKDRDLIAQVTIKKNYQIQVMNSQGRDLSNDLSQGQKQILSLAFVMALAQVASHGREEMAFPLFMDTPFARIDGDNRDQLIEAIPSITGQWVLLLTDTEFTAAERDAFVRQGSVGSGYRLENDNGETKIAPVADLSLIELRGEDNG